MNNVLLKCKRSKTEIWRKEDVERFFEMTDDVTNEDSFTNKNFNEKFNKYSLFIIEPRSRFSQGKDVKLKNNDSVIYFSIYGVDNISEEHYVKYVFCGYAIGSERLLKTLK